MLTKRQRDFCLAFIETGDAFAAYLRAYAVKDGTPREATEKRAVDVLALETVQARIAELRANPRADAAPERKPEKAKASEPKREQAVKAEPKKRKKGVQYGQDVADELCTRIALGESLAQVCKQEGMPSLRTVFAWRSEHPEFEARYQIAWQQRAEARLDKIDELVEQVVIGKIDPNAGRVAIDALKWAAAREQPKRFGDRTVTELTGKDGGPITMTGEPDVIEAARRISFLLGRGLMKLEELRAQKQIEGRAHDQRPAR